MKYNQDLLNRLPDHLKALFRPLDYLELSAQEQWEIDKALGILDWDGTVTDDEPDIDVWFYAETYREVYGWKAPCWLKNYYHDLYADKEDAPTWYEFVRPLEISGSELDKMNGSGHCIFGQYETAVQETYCPKFLYNSDAEELTIRVVWK